MRGRAMGLVALMTGGGVAFATPPSEADFSPSSAGTGRGDDAFYGRAVDAVEEEGDEWARLRHLADSPFGAAFTAAVGREVRHGDGFDTQSASADTPPAQLSGTEIIFGTGNVEGVSSNGAMAVGVAPEGEITVLKWPSPSYDDQVRYLTPILLNEDTGAWRERAYNGARPSDGIFAGIHYRLEDGREGVAWFRSREEDDGAWDDEDPGDDWVHEISYRGATSPVVVVRATNNTLGLQVKTLTVVLPNDDDPFHRDDTRTSELLIHHRMERAADSPVVEASWLFYENAAPINRRPPAAPLRDQVGDPLNDFAALYHAERDAIVHFRPAIPQWWRLHREPHQTQEEIDDLIDRLDELFLEPDPEHPCAVYLAMAARVDGSPRSAQHQVGTDGGVLPLDAWEDAQDGVLQGSSFSAPLPPGSNACLTAPVRWRPRPGSDGDAAIASFYVAAAHRADEALRRLEEVRAEPVQSQIDRAEAWWATLLAPARLPAPDLGDAAAESLAVATAQRALVNIFAATDKGTGAIVASINTQSPYGQDWPRDGSFFNLALDLAGYHDLVTQRNADLYPRWSRPPFRASWWWPGMILPIDLRGTYEMNYYANGVVGGPIFFEIDNTGLVVWSQWDHYLRLRETVGRWERRSPADSDPARDYLASVSGQLWESAWTLARCEDWRNGLQCTAFEDDQIVPSQTLHGAITVWMALDAALASADSARALDLPEPPERWERRWRRRKDELTDAIWRHFFNGSNFGGGGAGAWLLFPAGFLPPDSPEAQAQAQYLLDEIAPHLLLETDGASYLAKQAAAIAAVGFDGEATHYPGFDIEEAVRIILVDMPTPGTRQYGEVFVNVDHTFDHRTTVPHVWEGALAYIAGMLLWPPPPSSPPQPHSR